MSKNKSLGRVAVLGLFGVLGWSSPSIASKNSFQPVKTTCGVVEASGQPFVVIDYDIKQPSKEQGSHTDKYANIYNEATYPVPQYRLIGLGSKRFRVGTVVAEETYAPDQFVTYLSIYEEAGDKLVQRSYTVVQQDMLRTTYQFGYSIPGTQSKISCFASLRPLQAKNWKNSPRKPAKESQK